MAFKPLYLQDQTAQNAQYAANDAQAESEGADYEAQANQAAAQQTNSLAQTLAGARNTTPGGGIRIGMKKKGFGANAASGGLTAANAAGRVARKKQLLKSQTDAQMAAQQAQRTTELFDQQRAGATGNGLQLINLW